MILYKRKYRYICIHVPKKVGEIREYILLEQISRRYIGLFGHINFKESSIRVIDVKGIPDNFFVIKCKLENVDDILLSTYFTNYPCTTLCISGTIKKIKKKIQDLLIYEDLLQNS